MDRTISHQPHSYTITEAHPAWTVFLLYGIADRVRIVVETLEILLHRRKLGESAEVVVFDAKHPA